MAGASKAPPSRRALPAEVVITHAGADFDGLASMFCARKLYPGVVPLLIGPPNASVRAFLSAYAPLFPVEQARRVEEMPLVRVVIVDCQTPSRLGPFREVVSDPRVEVHVYDHHPPSEEGIRGDAHNVACVGATTTMLVTRLMERSDESAPVSAMEATLFALGIYEETGSLTFPGTTPQDVLAVAWLLERGAMLSVVADCLQAPLREEQHALLRGLLERLEVRSVRGMSIAVASVECDAYVGELAAVTERMMDLERPDAVLCAARMGERVYITGRSREQGPDVAAVLARFGGGGHARAASASLPALAFEGLREALWRAIEETARPPLCARDVMTSPVQVIELDDAGGPTLEVAHGLLVRYGHTVLPVVQRGRLRGTLSRRDADKAMGHGLGATPTLAYVTPAAPTASADIAVAALMRQMAAAQGRIIIVDDAAQVIGMVTRADVLATFHREIHPDASMQARLAQLPPVLVDLLRCCGEVADAQGLPVYAIGGFVRDLLLGRENLDVDVVVEGDGVRYASALAHRLGGRVRVHPRFGTAVVTFAKPHPPPPGGVGEAGRRKIDVASTRLEFYTRPAALPQVEGSTLKQDLSRRDFTINALAIQLNAAAYGRLVDYFGGRRDLDEGVVRVLHNLSFIDDPTRIFRAVKFEQRLHFRMDPHTEQLLRQAVHGRMLEALSLARVRGEFEQMLSEARPVPGILRLAELGALRLIHPALQLTPRVRERLEAVTRVIAQYADCVAREGVLRWLIYFRALVSGLGDDDLRTVSQRYVVEREAKRRLLVDRSHVRQLLRRLYLGGLAPSEVYRLLSPLSLEMLLYLLARAKARSVRERIIAHLERLRWIKPVVTGDDLMAWGVAPGPRLGQLLDALFDAQLDGRIGSVDEARAWLAQEDIGACDT